MNATTAVGLVLVGVVLGAKLRELWDAQPAPHPACLGHGAEQRTTQALCRCSDCQAPFLQESPAEVQ